VEISAALGEFCLRVEEKQFKAMVELLGEVTDYGQTLRKQ
jgi:CRISPR/Cas system-associated protein endoribonuclease Cas2